MACETLEDRLARLEARNAALEQRLRRAGRLATALAVAAGVGLVAGFDKIKTVETTRLVINDETGKERLSIGASNEGIGIRISDENGKMRVALGEGTIPGHGEGAGLWIFDKNEKPRVGLGAGDDGEGLILLDENGKPVTQGKAK